MCTKFSPRLPGCAYQLHNTLSSPHQWQGDDLLFSVGKRFVVYIIKTSWEAEIILIKFLWRGSGTRKLSLWKGRNCTWGSLCELLENSETCDKTLWAWPALKNFTRSGVRFYVRVDEQRSWQCNSHITLGCIHTVVQGLNGHPAYRKPPLKAKQQIHIKLSAVLTCVDIQMVKTEFK